VATLWVLEILPHMISQVSLGDTYAPYYNLSKDALTFFLLSIFSQE
jgi:hypothetical protein